jgi:hypothetical protein
MSRPLAAGKADVCRGELAKLGLAPDRGREVNGPVDAAIQVHSCLATVESGR